MLPPFIRRRLKPPTGGLRSWLAEQQLRRARIKRQKQLRWQHRFKRLGRAVMAVGAIFVAAVLTGFFMPIGIEGAMLTVLAMAIAFVLLLIFPRPRAPARDTLRSASLASLANMSETWLEARRPLLSPPLQRLADHLGASLESLSPQLAGLGENAPVAGEIRGLLGEHLPTLVESYVRIPEAHRNQPDAGGSTPEEHLSNGLAIIAREIDTLTGQIARGELDQLAIRGRYLETRYLGAGEADGA